MTQITYDLGFERAQALAADMAASKERNEATTRLQLVDRLLFDCLGWDRDDAVLEEHRAGEYADYVLPRQRRRLIVEAKKEGTTFALPEGLDRISNLDALHGLKGAVADALVQVGNYAHERGAPYAAICNGHQLIAFIASRQDGVGLREGQALVFDSPNALIESFSELWENLSPTGVASMRLTKLLGGKRQSRPPKLSESIKDYPGTAPANERQYLLTTLNVLFLPDYVRNDENEDKFLLECYCPPGAFSRLAMLNRSVLRTRYSLALGEELKMGLNEAVTKDGLNPDLRDEVAVSSAGKEPLVLLGDVGVGKTMFLRRLLRVDAKDVASNGIILYTDLGRDAVLADVKTHVATSFKGQLLNGYDVDIDDARFLRGTYQAEVKRFAKGIHGALAQSDTDEFKRREIDYLAKLSDNIEEHLRRSLIHLVTLRKQQVIVVLDNVDQRLQADQEEVFLIAESIAKTWPCSVFVTLRPETFNASRIDGTLSGYQPRAFTVQPPRVEHVVAKRLEFGVKSITTDDKLPEWLGWTADSDDVRLYLSILQKSIKRSEPLQQALVNLSGGNVRRALELMSTFVNSPHGEHQLTLDRNRGTDERDYLIPAHAFLKAALLGDAVYYSPDQSRIPNLFDISTVDAREHFVLSGLLGLLHRAASEGHSEGYVVVENCYATFQDVGFTPVQIDFALQRALSGALIEALPPEASVDDAKSVRITAAGVFAYQSLLEAYQYYDAIVVDTPITDVDRREGIKIVKSVESRLERAETFIEYLNDAWSASGLQPTNLVEWPRRAQAVEAEIASIRSKLSKPTS